jgi:hypothetical protein
MLMDLRVKVPQEEIQKAAEEIDKFTCLRKEIVFNLMNGKWRTNFVCRRYGNGYGVGFSCSEKCSLRITDLDKCREIKTDYGSYLVQDDFYSK